MSNFVVSARKYRPQLFAAIRGQPHVVTTLQNAIKNQHIASAYLFCGLKGSGKTTSARLLAKAINCNKTSPEGESCNTCKSCRQTPSLNIHELDAASHNSAEDMRQIVDQIRYHPPQAKKNVIIIDEAHMLSNAALNVLLKPLEDTPSHVVFILVTTEKHKIIPTILSRCQVFDFHHISITAIVQQLQYIAKQENITYEEDGIALIAKKATGSLRDALSIFDLVVTFSGNKALTYQNVLLHLNLLDEHTYMQITDLLYAGDIKSALLQYDDIARSSFDSAQFMSGLGNHLRNLLVAQASETMPLMQVSKKVQKAYESKARTIAPDFIYEALALAQQAELQYKLSLNPRLHVEMMLIKIGKLRTKKQGQQRDEQTINVSLSSKKSSNTQGKKSVIPKFAPHATTDTPATLPQSAKNHQKKPLYTQDTIQESGVSIVSEPTTPAIKTKANPPMQTVRIPNTHQIKKTINTPKRTPTPSQKATTKQEEPSATVQEISNLWLGYAEKLQKKGDYMAYSALQEPITLQGTQIVVSVTHPIHKETITELSSGLMEYLRKELAYPSLTLITKVQSSTKTKMAYTDKEKMEELTKKNPCIAYLVTQLGLVTK